MDLIGELDQEHNCCLVEQHLKIAASDCGEKDSPVIYLLTYEHLAKLSVTHQQWIKLDEESLPC